MIAFELVGQRISTKRRRSARSHVRFERLDPRILLSGVLDSSFAGSGLLTSDFGADDYGYAVAIQSNGRILAAGTVRTTAGGNDFGILRLMPDGSPDTSFGTGGRVTLDFGTTTASNDEARAIAIDSSGRILVAGYANRGSNNDFAVARFLSNGARDTSFGVNGRVVSNFVNNDQAFAMVIQSDGKIIVGGLINSDFGLARYNVNGSIDTGFSTSGVARTNFGTGLDAVTSLAIQSDGRLVAGGYSTQGAGSDFAVARYNANGALDSTFDGDGTAVTNVGASNDVATSVAVMSDGRIVLAGRSGTDVAVVRYTSNGAPDSGFRSAGIATLDLGGANDSANALALLSDGRIVLAGGSGGLDGSRNFALMQLNLDGSVDSSFGIVSSDFSSDRDEAFAMALQGDGKIVVVGSTSADSLSSSTFDFGIARYRNNQAPQANPGGPYSVPEGSTVQLAGDTSFDPDGSIVSYEWDFDYDGTNFSADATGASAAFDAMNLDGPTSRLVALRVTDDSGETRVATTTVDVTNVAPTITISGNGSSDEGSAYALTLGPVSDPGGDTIAQYIIHWGDGQTSTVDAANLPADRAVQHTYSSGGSSYAITIDLIDEDGAHFDRANPLSVTVNSVPTGITMGGRERGVAGQTFAFEADLGGSAASGPRRVIWDFGDGKTIEMIVTGGTASARHVYCRNGSFRVKLTVVGSSRSGAFAVSVVPFLLESDPANPGPMNLFVGGTTTADRIKFKYQSDKIELWMNGRRQGLFNVTGRIVAYGNDGNDQIVMHGCWNRGAEFHGGKGNDLLMGGRGNDTLNGDAGNDMLMGHDGHDLLRGGAGNDVLLGQAGNDTLDGGAGRDLLHGGPGRNRIITDAEDLLM